MRTATPRDARMMLRLLCGSYSWSYPLLRYAPARGDRFASNREKMVNRATDLCVEGFPHSGNTFFTRLIRHWNPDVKLARHMHVPCQVTGAVKAGIPAFVLIRDPAAALSSLLHRYPDLHPWTACMYYCMFYGRIESSGDRFLPVRFEEMIRNPLVYLDRANRRFGISLHFEDYSEAVEKTIVRKIPGKVEKERDTGIMEEREKIAAGLRQMKIFRKACDIHARYCDADSAQRGG